MALSFNADEVLEMGLQIERNGSRFYRRAAEGATHPEVKELLLELAEMEADHEKLFAELKAKLPPGAAPEMEYDPHGETALYLRAAADTHVFNTQREHPELLSGKESPEEVLEIAIRFEKDSVVFFLGLKDMVPDGLGKAEVEGLIHEEMNHVTSLSQTLEALSSGS